MTEEINGDFYLISMLKVIFSYVLYKSSIVFPSIKSLNQNISLLRTLCLIRHRRNLSLSSVRVETQNTFDTFQFGLFNSKL